MEEHMNKSQVYAEVYAALSALGGEYIRKTPQKVLDVIADRRDKQYGQKFDENTPLNEKTLSKEAIAMLASLKLDYWCKTASEKQTLQDLLNLHDKKRSRQPLSKSNKNA